MIRATDVYLLIPFAIMLIDGHPSMRIAGLSLAAFISIVASRTPRERSATAPLLMDLLALVAGLGCYFAALWLAVSP